MMTKLVWIPALCAWAIWLLLSAPNSFAMDAEATAMTAPSPEVSVDNSPNQAREQALEQAPGQAAATEGQAQASNEAPQPVQIEEVEIKPQALFKNAYVEFKAERWQEAATGFLAFIQATSVDERNYEWAEFFLGICLDKLGFSHAAVDRFSNLAARKPNTKIVSYVLDMFEKISRTQAFDYDQVILQVVNDKDYGFISGPLEGFVHYYQGIQDWQTGHRDWAQDHFKRIPQDSLYYPRFLFHQAIYAIQAGTPRQALADLAQVLQHPNLEEDLADEAKWVAARLHYELGEHKEAAFLYQQIKRPVVQQASFLLERAWIAYQQKDYERSMGYLYAFDAPSFRQFFTPEYYILKSFIYKDVCHYESALSVVTEFQNRYGRSLEAIYDRKKETDQEGEELLFVILAKKPIKKRWAFIQLLEQERALIDDLDSDELASYVSEVYQLQVDETSYELRKQIEAAYAEHANELLQYEEESNLMRYEIGVDMYQRVAQASYQPSPQVQPFGGTLGERKTQGNQDDSRVKYAFQHEYWNDELGHYQVDLPNNCKSFEDWDLFFE